MSDDAALPPATAPLGLSVQIPGYRLEEQIGRGGMAVVFRAYDERLHRQVALKILTPAPDEYEAFRHRFIRESHAAAAVDDPNIIPVYEAGEANGVLFIAMRLVRGGDLGALMERHGPLSPGRAEWIVAAVASALDAAHASGLVHRDVKPANMLLEVRPGRPDHVYLSDFGVSKAALSSGGLTGSGQFLGTVDYAAPEQIHGHRVDGRTDQYALGCAAFELLSGRPPFSDKHWLAVLHAQISQPAPALTSLRPELPAAVDGVFARVLAKSPDDRYETCQEFARALRTALGVQPYAVDDLPDARQLVIDSSGHGDATLDPAVFGRRAVMIGGEGTGGAAIVGRPGSVADASEYSVSAEARTVAGVTAPGDTANAGRGNAIAPGRRRLVVFGMLGAAIVLTGAAIIGLTLARSPTRQQQDLAAGKQGSKPVLQHVTVTPPSLHLAVGQHRKLTLRGVLSDGTSAPAADLAKAVWTTSDPAVASVNSRGEVIAESTGVTRVTADIGSVRASAVVTVAGPATVGPGPGNAHGPQGGPSTSTSASPASSPSATGTPSPTTSPSPTGTPSPSLSSGSPQRFG